jgi:hypothetical protein
MNTQSKSENLPPDQEIVTNGLPFILPVYSEDEKRRVSELFRQSEEAGANQQEINLKLIEVMNDNIRRTSSKTGQALERKSDSIKVLIIFVDEQGVWTKSNLKSCGSVLTFCEKCPQCAADFSFHVFSCIFPRRLDGIGNERYDPKVRVSSPSLVRNQPFW